MTWLLRYLGALLVIALLVSAALVVGATQLVAPFDISTIRIDDVDVAIGDMGALSWLLAFLGIALALLVVLLLAPLALLTPIVVAAAVASLALLASGLVVLLVCSPALLLGWVVWLLVRRPRRGPPGSAVAR